MKPYPNISGPKKSPLGLPCIAFIKHDGSNLRFEYGKKQGWWKFGTRTRLFDAQDQEYGRAIEIFKNNYAEGLERVFRDNKQYRGLEKATVFCEFFGPSSFAGWHDFSEQFELCMFDIDIHKKGFVTARDFVNNFGQLKLPEVMYEGNFNKQFINDVKANKYGLNEGVVAKGVKPTGKPPHNLWSTKVKTSWWLQELLNRSIKDESLKKVFEDNVSEQIFY